MREDLIERLRAMAESDMVPMDRAMQLMLEAADALEAAWKDAQIREVEEEMHGLVIRAHPLKKGQRVRVVPVQGEEESRE